MIFSTFRNKSALFFKSWFKIFSHIKTTKGNKMETIKKYYIMQRNNASTKMPVFFFNEMLNKTPANNLTNLLML